MELADVEPMIWAHPSINKIIMDPVGTGEGLKIVLQRIIVSDERPRLSAEKAEVYAIQ